MPDMLTGQEEQDTAELIASYIRARSRLRDEQAVEFSVLTEHIEHLSATLADEVPTPHLCPDCNPRSLLDPLHCVRSGHEIGEDGLAIKQPAYLELGVLP